MLQQGCERPISPKSGIFFGITSRLSITSVLPPHPTHPDSLIRFRSLDRVRLLECRFSRGRVVSFGITHAALPSGRSWHEKPASGARHPPGAGRGAGHLQLVEVSRPIHAGAGNLSAYERTKLALRLEEAIAGRAKERQQGGQGGVLLCQKSDEAIDTKREIAKAAGVSHDTVATRRGARHAFRADRAAADPRNGKARLQ